MAHPDISIVIDKHRKFVYAICMGILCDTHLAEDAMQDVFERIIKKADDVLELEEPRQTAYISVVARNRAIDILEKERIRLSRVMDVDLNSLTTMDIMVRNTLVDDYGFSFEIRDLILKLDGLERDIIIMKYGFGYTYRDIAELLEKKERHIYHKAQTAHKKLYEAIVEGERSK